MLIKYKKQLKGVIIGLIISLIIAFVPFRMQRIIELKTLDFRIAHRHDIPVSSDIVVICIDNETIKKIGKWAISRDYYGLLLYLLSDIGVKTIGFDILFAEAEQGAGNMPNVING
ncbi:MAG: CHASE2 domain-containing protein [Candidatus Desantisbacteria bacterium]